MEPRVLFGGGAATPSAQARVSRTVAKTPAAVRLRYLTQQLATHRERISELEERNSELEAICGGSKARLAADASSHDPFVAAARIKSLEAEVWALRQEKQDLLARAHAADDRIAELRAARGRARRSPCGLLSSPLTPSHEYAAILAELASAQAEIEAEESHARSFASRERVHAEQEAAASGRRQVVEAVTACGDTPPRKQAEVLSPVKRAAQLCREGE